MLEAKVIFCINTQMWMCRDCHLRPGYREFVNKLSQHLFRLTGTKHKVTSAYHPQSNGLCERMNQTLQRCLLKMVNKQQNNWDVYLDPILFAYRTCKQKSTKYSPFEMAFGR